MMPFAFRAQARRDVEAAGACCAREAGGAVTSTFYAALDKAVMLLRQEPDAGSLGWSNNGNLTGLRSWPLKGFPYALFYTHRPNGIDVTRVLHTYRDMPVTLQE